MDTRSFDPSVVPKVMTSLLHPSDTGTIKRDVMGISYGSGLCFAMVSTTSACRWFLAPLDAHHSDPGWFPAGCQACTEGGKEYEAVTKRQNGVNLTSSICYMFFNVLVRVP